jgi:hypothetical protein
MDAAAPVIGRLVAASRLPVLRGALRDVTAIIEDLRSWPAAIRARVLLTGTLPRARSPTAGTYGLAFP